MCHTIHSGGIKLVFSGRDLNVVPTVMNLNVVNDTTNSTAVVVMSYNIVSISVCVCMGIVQKDGVANYEVHLCRMCILQFSVSSCANCFNNM